MEIKGAFWLKKAKNDSFYYSGNIEIDGQKTNCVMFPNDKKTSDKSPDFTIKESKPITAAVPDNNEDTPF